MSAPIAAIFFDVGETLVYAHPSSAEIMAAVSAEHGLDVAAKQFEAAEAKLGPRITARQGDGELYSISEANSERFWTWVYRELLAELGVEEARRPVLAGAFHNRFKSLETWRLFPDAVPALQAISQRRQTGLVMGVVSNWEDWLEALLMQLDIHIHFDFLVISANVRREKPDPAIFHEALQRAGVAPEQVLHVGDSLHADVGGAQAAGIRPVLLDRRGRYSPDQVRGATLIRSLAELPPLLDG